MPAARASIKFFVPDLAIVPKLLIRSSFVIPIPVSIIVRVFFSVFGIISICKFDSESSLEESVKLWYLILSRASEEFDTNSRKKTSLLL